MKKILSFILVVTMLVASALIVPVSATEAETVSVWDGKMPTVTATNIFTALGQDGVAGTETDPIVLDCVEDVAILAQFLLNGGDVWTANKGANGFPWFRLDCDIDLAGYEWPGIGTSQVEGKEGRFKGKFDGNGHVIYNLDLASDDLYAGFFGYLFTGNALVRNLGIASCEEGGIDIGGAIGRQYIGGLVGYADRATIENCFANVSFKSESTQQLCVGILMGKCDNESNYTYVKDSWCNGSIEIGTRTDRWVHAGILCGEISGKLTVTNCNSIGSIKVANAVAWDGIGAFVGQLSDNKVLTVSNTEFSGSVTMESALVTNCNMKAIIGYENGTETFTNCQYNVTCSANDETIAPLTYPGLVSTANEINITSSNMLNEGSNSVAYQLGTDSTNKIRFVSTLGFSHSMFVKAGFIVDITYTAGGKTYAATDVELSDGYVYNSLLANGETVYAQEQGVNGVKTFVAHGITDIPACTANFNVTPFVETADGVRIYGESTQINDVVFSN